MAKSLKKSRGFILPFSMIFAFIILTVLGLWYKETLFQSFLAERLVERRALYIESRSLVPVLLDKLDELTPDQLKEEREHFMIVEDGDATRWKIRRSGVFDGKVRFTFSFMETGRKPLAFNLAVKYKTDDDWRDRHEDKYSSD